MLASPLENQRDIMTFPLENQKISWQSHLRLKEHALVTPRMTTFPPQTENMAIFLYDSWKWEDIPGRKPEIRLCPCRKIINKAILKKKIPNTVHKCVVYSTHLSSQYEWILFHVSLKISELGWICGILWYYFMNISQLLSQSLHHVSAQLLLLPQSLSASPHLCLGQCSLQDRCILVW